MAQPIFIGAFKVNNVSSTSKVNLSYGINFMARHHSFNKSNSVNDHAGDMPLQVIHAPVWDQDRIDSSVTQFKLV